MNNNTYEATLGAGNLLDDIVKLLHGAGDRAMAHGTSLSIGIGGHATIGGLESASRLWGTALDHILEPQVVLANGDITTARPKHNADLLWALRGAGAGFGVITEFKVRTRPEPTKSIRYDYMFNLGSDVSNAQLFKDWQKFFADPSTPRELTGSLTLQRKAMRLYGTYIGSKAKFDKLNLETKFPNSSTASILVFESWLDLVAQVDIDLRGASVKLPRYFDARSVSFAPTNSVTTETDQRTSFLSPTIP
jgi:FAD/FMN-containing dehydrogenase